MSFLPYDGGSGAGWAGAFGLSALAHGAVFVAILGIATEAWQRNTEDTRRTDFVITLERLDADTLAGFVEQTGMAGAQGDVATGTDPESIAPEATAPDSVDPVPPETPPAEDPPAPETPPEVPTETPQPTTPEALTPETVAAADSADILAPEPVLPEAVTAIPVAPDDVALSPILPETVNVNAPVADTTVLTPVAPAPQAVTAAPADRETVTAAPPDAGTVQTVTAVTRPAAPANPDPGQQVSSAAPPSAQDLAIGDLIERIRGALSDPCLIALPRRDGADGVGLAMIAAQDGAMESFAQDVLTADDADIRQTRTLVDPRQCPALTYIRQNTDYPATRMGMRIDTLEIASGGRLTGVLRGGSGRYITLLLIDDNGVVQDLQRFMSFSGNLARFDVPVTRSGPSRDTSQILLALGTQRPPVAIRDRNGQLAQDVFAGLAGELANGAYLAIATFDVR